MDLNMGISDPGFDSFLNAGAPGGAQMALTGGRGAVAPAC